MCYVFDGRVVYSALDEKPKRVAPTQPKRVRNIQANPRVALVIDDYAEDWRTLAYLQLRGRAELLLRAKYTKYEAMAIDQQPVLRITPEDMVAWGAIQEPLSTA